MSGSLYMMSQISTRPGLEEDAENPNQAEEPMVRMDKPERKSASSSNQEIKKSSTHKSKKKHHHHHSSSKRHSHHGNSDRNHKHRSSDKSSSKDSTMPPKEDVKSLSYSPESCPPVRKHHQQSVPKSKMHKLQEEDAKHQTASRRSSSQGNSRRHDNELHVTGVPITTTSAVRERAAPNQEGSLVPYRNENNSNAGNGNGVDQTSYPGAYREGSEDPGQDDLSLYDVENGGNLITAHVVPNEDTYTVPPPSQENATPREVVTRSAPLRQTMEAPKQVNETKQSLNISVPQGAAGAVAPSIVQHSERRNGNGCCICGAVAFALVGVACVVFFFILPVLGIWLLIPGIVFLIVSCVFCCCICSRSGTNVTTVISQ